MDTHHKPRKLPVQARSKRTVEWVLEGAARVFRSEGFDATTNRIAEAAGVSIGTLYEYFPNKSALLVALAEQHVAEAESGIAAALHSPTDTRSLLEGLQLAILRSQRYPSQALGLVGDPALGAALRARVASLRARMLDALLERAVRAALPNPALRARTAFELVAELTSLTAYELNDPEQHRAYASHFLALASAQLDSE